MQLHAFCLYDAKAQFFHAPFFHHHAGQAIRLCIELGGDVGTTVGRHPGDFVLYRIGSFDDQTAVLDRCPPENLGVIASFLPRPVQLPLEAVASSSR